jgi:hypothetical protein
MLPSIGLALAGVALGGIGGAWIGARAGSQGGDDLGFGEGLGLIIGGVGGAGALGIIGAVVGSAL